VVIRCRRTQVERCRMPLSSLQAHHIVIIFALLRAALFHAHWRSDQ
jgi:hypothetical protein